MSPRAILLSKGATRCISKMLRQEPFTKKIRTLTTKETVILPRNHDIKIVEVGPRDGLQNEPNLVATGDKIQLVKMLAHAGCSYIEAGSFVSKEWVPNMADSQAVLEGLGEWKKQQQQQQQQSADGRNHPLPVLSCLTPNRQGFDQAVQLGNAVDEIAIFGSASEAFSQKNINCSIQESLDRFAEVAEQARAHNIPMRGYVSCVLGCPYQGTVDTSKVAMVTEKLLELGCHEISLGDTIGIGTPGSTRSMLKAVKAVCGTDKLAVHFHDTYGMAIANILVAIEEGITVVDSSVAGLGGCPYAKGASGNVATEEVVYMVHALGLETGIDLEKLVDAGNFICGVLGKPTQSKVGQALLAKRT